MIMLIKMYLNNSHTVKRHERGIKIPSRKKFGPPQKINGLYFTTPFFEKKIGKIVCFFTNLPRIVTPPLPPEFCFNLSLLKCWKYCCDYQIAIMCVYVCVYHTYIRLNTDLMKYGAIIE